MILINLTFLILLTFQIVIPTIKAVTDVSNNSRGGSTSSIESNGLHNLRMLASVAERYEDSNSPHSQQGGKRVKSNGSGGRNSINHHHESGLGLGQPGGGGIHRINDQEANSSRLQHDKKGKRPKSPSSTESNPTPKKFKLFGKEIEHGSSSSSSPPPSRVDTNVHHNPNPHQQQQSINHQHTVVQNNKAPVKLFGVEIKTEPRLFGVNLQQATEASNHQPHLHGQPVQQQHPIIHTISSDSENESKTNKRNRYKPLKVKRSSNESVSSEGLIESDDSGYRSIDALSRKMPKNMKNQFTSTSKYSRRNKLEKGNEVYIHGPYPSP